MCALYYMFIYPKNGDSKVISLTEYDIIIIFFFTISIYSSNISYREIDTQRKGETEI